MATLNATATLYGSARLATIDQIAAPAPRKVDRDLSAVEINQNQPPERGLEDENPDQVDLSSSIYQTFYLPDNYARGFYAGEVRYPEITGFQVFVTIPEGYAKSATLHWTFEEYLFGSGYNMLAQGTTIGNHADGDQVWFEVYFDSPIEASKAMTNNQLRIGIRAEGTPGAITETPVIYDGKTTVVIEGDVIRLAHPLVDGVATALYRDQAGFLLYDESTQVTTWQPSQGVTDAWFSVPNPLTNGQAALANGTPVRQVGDTRTGSLMFRLMTHTADDGTDFLGNSYRSVVIRHPLDNAANSQGGLIGRYWLSQPNPSRFAVESLYFDLSSEANEPVTVDRVYLDPVTTDVYFSVYYSSDGSPGIDSDSWEKKLWTRVPITFRMSRKESHILPQPINAKYVKLEFSHLQARSYSPPTWQKPISYKKHPKWVLDYFLLRTEAERTAEDDFIPREVTVLYDSLDLAYNYYLDDIRQGPETPAKFAATRSYEMEQFYSNRADLSDKVDVNTWMQISTTFKPYEQNPALMAKVGNLLGEYVINTAIAGGPNLISEDYPVEQNNAPTAYVGDVSSLRRDAVVFEQSYPVMFFWLKCRHSYRELTAPFTYNRAYFVGVREVAFTREHYTRAHDHDNYIEAVGDELNLERNDFAKQGTSWVLSSETKPLVPDPNRPGTYRESS